ncbi:MAG: hypothetical protein ACFFEA_15245, partial [Candidatus Thorarchaeota archaeon]
ANCPVLLVVDSIRDRTVGRISMDVWSDYEGIELILRKALTESRIGNVREDLSSIEVAWNLDMAAEGGNALVLTITPNSESFLSGERVYFQVDYQGLVSESFEATLPQEQERLSVALDLNNAYATWEDDLDAVFFAISLSDESWKNLDRYHRLAYSWYDVLKQQIRARLQIGKRFLDIQEFAASMNMKENDSSALKTFIDFTLRSDLAGCESQRVSSHCSRAAILTGLVICFNPARGLSGYLTLLTGPLSPPSLSELGTQRTWRDHISQIVQLSGDFKPQTGKLTITSKRRSPGRPPTQLVPTTHPVKLLEQFLNDPESLVCQYCRFLD